MKQEEKVEASRHEEISLFSLLSSISRNFSFWTVIFPNISAPLYRFLSLSLPLFFLPLFFFLVHTSFSLSLSLSINPRAVGVVELVFPPADKGLYRTSLTLEGSKFDGSNKTQKHTHAQAQEHGHAHTPTWVWAHTRRQVSVLSRCSVKIAAEIDGWGGW